MSSEEVGAAQDTGDLTVTYCNLNGPLLQGAAGNTANLSGGGTNASCTVQIDTLAPTVTSVVSSGAGIDGSGNGDLNAGHLVTLTVNMSEAVTGGGGTPEREWGGEGKGGEPGGRGTT